MSIRRIAPFIAAVAIVAAACSTSSGSAAPGGSGATTAGCTVGVSWNNFQQPRWAAKDRPSMQKVVIAGGGIYIDFDANLSNTQQLTDVQTLINQGADVIVLLAQDDKAGAEVVKLATQNKIPVIAYDRLIEDSSVLYLSFDNTDVGFAEADAMFKKVPKGNYVLIKGDPGDANASKFLPAGWDKAGLKDKVASGDIKIIGPADGTYTPAWDTDQGPEQHGSDHRQGQRRQPEDRRGPGRERQHGARRRRCPEGQGLRRHPDQRSGRRYRQPAERRCRIQYVDVWKNANELGKAAGAAALQLCSGKKMADLELPAGLVLAANAPAKGNKVQDFTTPGGNTVKSFILGVQPITQENLQLILDSKWLTKEVLCKNAAAGPSAAAICK